MLLDSTDGCLTRVAPSASLLVGEAARRDLGRETLIRVEQVLRLLELARHFDDEPGDLDDGARWSHAASGAGERWPLSVPPCGCAVVETRHRRARSGGDGRRDDGQPPTCATLATRSTAG